jgi:hypothetical protein
MPRLAPEAPPTQQLERSLGALVGVAAGSEAFDCARRLGSIPAAGSRDRGIRLAARSRERPVVEVPTYLKQPHPLIQVASARRGEKPNS